MKISSTAWIACVVLASPFALSISMPGTALAQNESGSLAPSAGGVSLFKLIETVSKKTGKNFILDPRANANVGLVGIDPAKITYPELLAVLQVHGFAAIESGGIVRVVPDSLARTAPSPVIGGNDKLPDAEIVTRIFKVKNISAPQLVPILRSLLPQSAHLAAYPCTNEMLIVDTFANVRRIESIVATMDKGDGFTPPKCDSPLPSRPSTTPTDSPRPAP